MRGFFVLLFIAFFLFLYIEFVLLPPIPVETGSYVVKKLEKSCPSYLVSCDDMTSKVVTQHYYFRTKVGALGWMSNQPKDSIIGLFELSEIPLKYVKTGTKKTTKEVEEDVFEWKIK